MIFADRRGMLKKLLDDKDFEIIAEIYAENSRLIAGLFQKKAVK